MREFLKSRPELAKEIEAKIMDAAGITTKTGAAPAPEAEGDDA